MQIDGKFTGTTERSDFIRVKEGTYTFNGDVELNAAIGGRIFSAGGATVNFNGDTTINNTSVFLDITPNTDPTFNFNKLTITNNSQPANADAIFALRGGTTNFRANTTILAPNTVAIKLGNATLTNDGELSVTSKDGIAIHTIPETSQTSTFINKKNGVLSTTESAIVNDGEGELVINNQGKLSASDSAIFTNTSSGNITATNTGELKGFLDHSNITLNNLDKGLWQVTKDSNIGTLTNTGTIEFPTTNVGTTVLTADTYTGGGKLLVNSRWNEGAADPLNGESQSDLLKINNINGDAVTTVQINAASLGNITQKSQEIFSTNVVEVANDHSGNLFVGKAATDSGVEAQLKRNGNNYRWTLTATTPTDEVLIVSKPIAGYIQMPYINQQMGLSQLGQLHKRVGEQYTGQLGKEKQDTQIWGRVYMDSQDLQGKDRFGSKVQSGFLQFGKDFAFNLTSDNAQSHTGMMVTYGWANSKFYDKYRAENGVVVADKFTGKAHTDMLSIGGYHTYYSPNRFYVDIIGQLSWLQNQYKSEQTVKQHGYGIATSVEIGKSFKLGNSHFAIEPQAQLTYQWLNLQNFNDGIRYVKAKDQHNLTARLGSRLTYSDETLSSAKFNLSANLIQTLVGRSSKIKVGDQNFDERFSNLALELGLGTDIPLTQSLNFYADVRYTRSLSDRNQVFRNSSLGKSSYNTSLGLRYIW
ncbi:autotransporter outer membrane beta-barrel domain-containing protein [Avibacterium paragallinarum]|uniref:autotransporter outer membrane beta-barrel domain-containing protein n=1 Tax=Avibacterium paragallinarum TaxID=728 RepID=UPI00397AACBE